MRIKLPSSSPLELPHNREKEFEPITSYEWIIRWPEYRGDDSDSPPTTEPKAVWTKRAF